jgi:hypothetical protein
VAKPSALRRKLQFQYRFDRLFPDKLQHACQLLVPDHARPVGGSVTTFPQENMHGARSQPCLVHSPDRLSRKYADQVLLAEEFSRCGVKLVFLPIAHRNHRRGSVGGAVSGDDRGV